MSTSTYYSIYTVQLWVEDFVKWRGIYVFAFATSHWHWKVKYKYCEKYQTEMMDDYHTTLPQQ